MITAHYAGATPRYADRVTGIFTENLRRYQAGEPLMNVIDKERDVPEQLAACAVERHVVPIKAHGDRWAWAGVKHGTRRVADFMALTP